MNSTDAISVVVIDDERTFEGIGDLYIRSPQEALGFLALLWIDQYNHYAPDLHQLWLDHDLGGDDTIAPVVQFLMMCAELGAPLKVQEILIHSMNPAGWKYIEQGLTVSGYKAIRVPLPATIGG